MNAELICNYVNKNGFEADRGAFQLPDDTAVVFGNDSHQCDPRPARERELIRQYATKLGCEVVASAEAEGTWIIIINSGASHDNAAKLRRAVWFAWRGACDEVPDDLWKEICDTQLDLVDETDCSTLVAQYVVASPICEELQQWAATQWGSIVGF